MSTSSLGSRRLRLLALTTLVVVPLLAACNTTPIFSINGGGGAGGGSGSTDGSSGAGATDGGTDGGTGGSEASLDGGDAG